MSEAEDFAAHLAREVTTLCHCWRLTRRSGLVSGFTDHDRRLDFDGTGFRPETGFSATEAKDSLGLGVDTLDVEGALSSLEISEEDIAAGLYDGARIETFLVNWQAPAQHRLLRVSTVGKITASDGRFTAELESLAHTLERPSGRFVTRACDAELGDARCGFSLGTAGYHGTGAVLEVEPTGVVRISGLGGFAAGWFSLGVLDWEGGALAGRSVRVRSHRKEGATVRLVLEAGTGVPATGDGFSIVAGCDKAFATCKTKFANALNFRGFPHLPGNDAAYAYVSEGVPFDGKPLVP